MGISGRIAVVTGGARGIGRCYVEFLLRNGAKVCIADVLEEKAKSTVAELTTRFGNKICCAKCDVTKLDEIKAVLPIAEQRFGGKVSIWVNNAGVSIRDRDQRNTIIAVNVKGVMDGTYAAFDYMDKDCGGEGGNIVNITSIAGLVAAGGNPVYFTSKHAVTAFTQSFAHEITEKHPTSGVILSGLAPTFVRTDMTSNFSINSWDSEGTVYKMFHEYKGWEKAEDVAAGLISLLEREDSHNVILLVKGKVMKRIKTTIEELDW